MLTCLVPGAFTKHCSESQALQKHQNPVKIRRFFNLSSIEQMVFVWNWATNAISCFQQLWWLKLWAGLGIFVEGLWCACVPLEGSADRGFPWCVQPHSPQPHQVSPCMSGIWSASLSPLHQQQLVWTRLVLQGCWAVGQSLGHPADVCEPAVLPHLPDMLPGNWNGFRGSLRVLLCWVASTNLFSLRLMSKRIPNWQVGRAL